MPSEQTIERILLVDDEVAILSATKGLLQLDGYIVETATCVDEAIELLFQERFDLIVSDYRMRGCTGLDLYWWLEKSKIDIPFILTSGEYPEVPSGVRFLEKPFSVQDFFKTLVPPICAIA